MEAIFMIHMVLMPPNRKNAAKAHHRDAVPQKISNPIKGAAINSKNPFRGRMRSMTKLKNKVPAKLTENNIPMVPWEYPLTSSR